MASIYKRGRVWWVKYRVPGSPKPERESLGTELKSVALRKRDAIDARLRDPFFKRPNNSFVEPFWSKYMTWAQDHLSDSTIGLHVLFWGHLTEFCRPRKLGDITPGVLEDFKRSRLAAGNSQRTINNQLKDFQAIYNKAIKWGDFTGENPVRSVERYDVTDSLVDFHSDEEKGRLLAVVSKEGPTLDERNLEWAVLLIGWAGVRKKELSFCKWSWFDFENKIIRVVEDRKPTREFNFKIKTRRERIVPMHKKVCETLEPFSAPDGYLFTSARGPSDGKRYRFDCRNSLQSALRQVGLPSDQPFQRLRRSFGSSLYQNGVDLNRIAAWMGNSPKVCKRHYVGIRQEYDEEINRM